MTDNLDQLAMKLLNAVLDDDDETRRAVSRRIDAHNHWRRVAHFLAGLHAGYLEAADYRASTGRCLAADMDAYEQSAVA
jgi:hypothetical protein